MNFYYSEIMEGVSENVESMVADIVDHGIKIGIYRRPGGTSEEARLEKESSEDEKELGTGSGLVGR